MTTLKLCTKCAQQNNMDISIDVEEEFKNLRIGEVSSGFICDDCGLVCIGNIKGELKVIRASDEIQNYVWENY